MPATAKRRHKTETPFAVESWPIGNVKPYGKNPRIIPPEAIDAVANSIETFGFRQPIVVDKEGVIVVGHTRYRAALKLSMKVVPVHVATELTPEQAQAYRIADNSTNTLSEWDLEMLNLELSDLPNFDFEDFGLDLEAIQPQTLASEDEFDLDEAVAAIKEPKTKLGDVWLLGRHRLLCGDATHRADVERLMEGKLADCVWTDPPYNVAYQTKLSKEEAVARNRRKDGLEVMNDSMSDGEFSAFLCSAFEAALSVTREGGAIYVAHADANGEQFRRAFRESGWMMKQCLIWVKDVFVMGRQDYQWQHEPILYGWRPGAAHKWYADRTQTTVLQFERPRKSVEHPTMKPIGLVGYNVGNSSKRGNCVLDSFGGSGTTMMACEQIDREARLIELDPIYCDVIVQRWERLTGEKATR
jgi:DNA modification methylase